MHVVVTFPAKILVGLRPFGPCLLSTSSVGARPHGMIKERHKVHSNDNDGVKGKGDDSTILCHLARCSCTRIGCSIVWLLPRTYGSRLLLPAKACAGAPLEDSNSSVRGFTKELVFVKQAVEAAHACRRQTIEPCSTSPSRRSKLSESSVTPKLWNWIKTKRRTLVMNRNAR